MQTVRKTIGDDGQVQNEYGTTGNYYPTRSVKHYGIKPTELRAAAKRIYAMKIIIDFSSTLV